MSDMLELCLFPLDALRLAVRVTDVVQVVPYQPLTPVPLAPPMVVGLMNLRGEIVAGVDLRRQFGLGEHDPSRDPMNVVLQSLAGPVSLIVDDQVEVVHVDADDFEPVPETLPQRIRQFIEAACTVEDGLVLLLDVEKSVDVAHHLIESSP